MIELIKRTDATFEWVYNILLMLLFVLGAGFNNIFTVIGLIMTLISIFTARNNVQVMHLQFLLVPFCGIMYVGASFSLYNIILLCVVIRLFISKSFHLRTSIVGLALVLLFVDIYTMAISGLDAVKDLVTFNCGMLIVAFGFEEIDQYDMVGLTRKFASGMIVSSVAYTFVDYLPGIRRYISNAQFRLANSIEKVDRFSGLVGNPNHYTLALSLLIAALVVVILCRKSNAFDLIALVILIFYGIQSISNSFFISFLFTFALTGVYLLFKAPGRLAISVAAVCLIIIVYYTFFNTNYLSIILNRLSVSAESFDINSFTSNRVDHYLVYTEAITNSLRVLLFGNGYGALENGLASHNIFLETIYFYGLVGSFTMGVLLARVLAYSNQHGIGNLRFLVLAVFLVRGLAINANTSMLFPYYLIFVMLFLKSDCRLPARRQKKVLLQTLCD